MGKKKKEEDEEEDHQPLGCSRVRNPCKICLQTVDDNNGLQCLGACEAWVHFACLNYTPGKVSDIQGGLITVTCPCPDCKTILQKEFRTDPPFACNNVMCPANNPPSCDDPTCQANEVARRRPPKCPPPNTLRQCSQAMCHAYSAKQCAIPTSMADPCIQGRSFCGDMPGHIVTAPGPANVVAREGGPTQNDAMQQMCKTVGDLAKELNSLLVTMKGNQGGAQGGAHGGAQGGGCGVRGCRGITWGRQEQGNVNSCGGQGGCKICGSSHPGTNQEQRGGCDHIGEVKCSQPCHCPGNPGKKH